MPRYVLLVSDNPASAPPREVVTGTDGTADVKLPPGNYTLESDRPFVFRANPTNGDRRSTSAQAVTPSWS